MRYHFAFELDRHRSAATVQRTSGRDTNPAFTDTVLLDIGAFVAIEAHPNRLRQQGFVVVGAARVYAEAVRQDVGHWIREDGGGNRQRIASRQRGHSGVNPE